MGWGAWVRACPAQDERFTESDAEGFPPGSGGRDRGASGVLSGVLSGLMGLGLACMGLLLLVNPIWNPKQVSPQPVAVVQPPDGDQLPRGPAQEPGKPGAVTPKLKARPLPQEPQKAIDQEARAAELLESAEKTAAGGNIGLARVRCRIILEAFPGTKAAADAMVLLAKLSE